MIQSGILYTIDSTTGQATNKPLKGAWINFVQNDVIKVRTQTHGETGAYSVDVPFGKYTVNLAVGNVTVTMRAGQLFELKSDDNANAFQNWLYSTTADVDDTLLNSFKQIANDINTNANRAENAEKGAKQIEENMQNNSIGDTNGKWLKEGAGGLLGLNVSVGDLDIFSKGGLCGFYRDLKPSLYPSALNLNIIYHGYSTARMSGIIQSPIANDAWLFNSNTKTFDELYSTKNTRKDKNGVLHATTSTPTKDTLLVGDNGIGLTRTEHVTFPASTPINDRIKNLMARGNGIYRMIGGVGGATAAQNPAVLVMHSSDMDEEISSLFAVDMYRNRLSIAFCGGTGKPIVQGDLYTTLNTTKDANGTLKVASPIVQLFNDRIEHSGFKNAPIFEKLSTGVYKITNTNGLRAGLAVGDWYLELPKDRYGKSYFNVETERLDDGCIVRVYKPRTLYLPSGEFFPDKDNVLVEALEKVELNGALTDLKDEWRCILLRFREDQYTVANEPIFKLKGEKGRYEIYKPDIVEEIPAEEDIALLDQRAF